MWLHFEMIISQIKDIIIESDSHAVLGKDLPWFCPGWVLSRLNNMLIYPYGQADAIAFTIVRMKKDCKIASFTLIVATATHRYGPTGRITQVYNVKNFYHVKWNKTLDEFAVPHTDWSAALWWLTGVVCRQKVDCTYDHFSNQCIILHCNNFTQHRAV